MIGTTHDSSTSKLSDPRNRASIKQYFYNKGHRCFDVSNLHREICSSQSPHFPGKHLLLFDNDAGNLATALPRNTGVSFHPSARFPVSMVFAIHFAHHPRPAFLHLHFDREDLRLSFSHPTL